MNNGKGIDNGKGICSRNDLKDRGEEAVVRLVIFDFDGTLVDSKEVTINIYNQLAEKYGAKRVDNIEVIRRLSLLERIKKLDFPALKIPLFVAEFTRQYKHSLGKLAMVEGMKEVLLELSSKGYQLAIVSSNAESNIRDYFREKRLDVIGKVISSPNIWGKHKAIKKLLLEYKLNPSEAIYVGDEIRDIIACRKVGMKIIWVEWGYDLKETLKTDQPDYTASTPQEILSLLP